MECLAGALTELGTKHVIWRMNPKAITAPQVRRWPVLQELWQCFRVWTARALRLGCRMLCKVPLTPPVLALLPPQMFGRMDPTTGDWTDGVFAVLWRRCGLVLIPPPCFEPSVVFAVSFPLFDCWDDRAGCVQTQAASRHPQGRQEPKPEHLDRAGRACGCDLDREPEHRARRQQGRQMRPCVAAHAFVVCQCPSLRTRRGPPPT
jgi:hypothetical protein